MHARQITYHEMTSPHFSRQDNIQAEEYVDEKSQKLIKNENTEHLIFFKLSYANAHHHPDRVTLPQ